METQLNMFAENIIFPKLLFTDRIRPRNH